MNRRVKGSFRWSNYDQPRLKKKENLAPRARFELATLRLTADAVENLSALSGVAYMKFGAILTFLVAPNPAPKADHWATAGSSCGGAGPGSGSRSASHQSKDLPLAISSTRPAVGMPFPATEELRPYYPRRRKLAQTGRGSHIAASTSAAIAREFSRLRRDLRPPHKPLRARRWGWDAAKAQRPFA